MYGSTAGHLNRSPSLEQRVLRGRRDVVEDIAGITLKRTYDLTAPKGVNGRNSDNTLIMQRLGWAPEIRLRVGLEQTYRWIYDQVVSDRWIAGARNAIAGI